MKTLHVEMFDLKNEKDIEMLEGRFELHRTYLMQRLVYYSKTPEEGDIFDKEWKDSFKNYEVRLKRKSIVSLEKRWNDDTDTWQIEIEANGYPTTIFLYFKNEDKMKNAFDILFKYAFKTSFLNFLWP